MSSGQWVLLALIGTPLLVLARDAYNRRRTPRQLWLALGVLLAIVANLAITLYSGR